MALRGRLPDGDESKTAGWQKKSPGKAGGPHPKFPTIRELQIVAERDFPFPEEAWVQNRSSIVIGNDRDPLLQGDNWGAFSLGQPGGGPILVVSMGGGSYPGAPVARALAELQEVDHRASSGRVVWTKHWVLAPIVLQNRAK